MVGTGMEISMRIFLHEYLSQGGEGGIHHDKERFGSIRHFDHRSGKEHLFEFDECPVLLFSPVEGDPFLGQIVDRLGKGREAGDKLLVEVAKSNEGSDCFYQLGEFPLLHCSEFGRVHMYFPVLDHQS